MADRKLIVPVCRGNIARSAVAEVVIRQEIKKRNLGDKYETVSRGIQGTSVDPLPVTFPNIIYYKNLYRDSRPILEKLGIDLSSHISTPIKKDIAERASIILAMDIKTKRGLLELFPEHAEKVYLLSELVGEEKDIVDPEGENGPERQEQIFTQVRDTVINGFSKLITFTEGNNKIKQKIENS